MLKLLDFRLFIVIKITCLVFIFFCFLEPKGFAQETKDRVLIIDFDEFGTGNTQSARALTENLRVEIINSGQYLVVERRLMEEILKEQKLSLTGLVDPKTAVRIGKMVEANIIMSGSLSKIGSVFTLNYRIVDVESGLVKKAGSLNCTEVDELSQLVHNLSQMILKPVTLKTYKQLKITNSTGYNAMPSAALNENYIFVSYHSNDKGNDNVYLLKYDREFNLIEKYAVTNSSQWNSRYPKIALTDSKIYVFYKVVENINTAPKEEKNLVEILDYNFNEVGVFKTEIHPASVACHNGKFYLSFMSLEGSVYKGDILTHMIRNTYIGEFDSDFNVIKKREASFLNFDGCYSVYSDIAIADDCVFVAFESNEKKASTDIFISVFDLELNFIKKLRITSLEPSWENYPSLKYANGRLFLAYSSNEKGTKDVFLEVLGKDLEEITKTQLTSSRYSEDCPALIYDNGIVYVFYDIAESPYAFEGNRNVYLEMVRMDF